MGIGDILHEGKIRLSSKKLPKHIAISMKGSFVHLEPKGVSAKEICDIKIDNAKDIINLLIKINVPIVTFYVTGGRVEHSENFFPIMESMQEFFNQIKQWDMIHKNRVKISVFGKWYDLPSQVVDSVKEVIEDTKDYDTFFVNFCLNYDGQDEIADACKLISKQVQLGKLDPSAIRKDTIKENIYTSYFLPPDLIIETGMKHKLNSFLLWDSKNATIWFADKHWPEFTKADVVKAIEFWQGQ